jgi:hypothetical protein
MTRHSSATTREGTSTLPENETSNRMKRRQGDGEMRTRSARLLNPIAHLLNHTALTLLLNDVLGCS